MERLFVRHPQGRARVGEDDQPTGQNIVMTTCKDQSSMKKLSDSFIQSLQMCEDMQKPKRIKDKSDKDEVPATH